MPMTHPGFLKISKNTRNVQKKKNQLNLISIIHCHIKGSSIVAYSAIMNIQKNAWML